MSIIGTLLINLKANTATFDKNMKKSRKGVSRFQNSAKALRGTMIKLGVGFGAVALFKKSIAAFDEQERAVRSLDLALTALGDTNEQSRKNAARFASSVQRVTTIGDEAVLVLQSMAINIGKLSQVMSQQATKAAIGLSKSLGIDVRAAMLLVSRAAVGQTDTLTRYGIVIDKTKTKQEQFADVLQLGIKQFDLFAKKGLTVGEQLQQVNNSLGDFIELMGGGLAGAFGAAGVGQETFLTGLRDFIDAINTAIAGTRELQREIEGKGIKRPETDVEFAGRQVGRVAKFIQENNPITDLFTGIVEGVDTLFRKVDTSRLGVLAKDTLTKQNERLEKKGLRLPPFKSKLPATQGFGRDVLDFGLAKAIVRKRVRIAAERGELKERKQLEVDFAVSRKQRLNTPIDMTAQRAVEQELARKRFENLEMQDVRQGVSLSERLLAFPAQLKTKLEDIGDALVSQSLRSQRLGFNRVPIKAIATSIKDKGLDIAGKTKSLTETLATPGRFGVIQTGRLSKAGAFGVSPELVELKKIAKNTTKIEQKKTGLG